MESQTVWEIGRFDDLYQDDGISIQFPLIHQFEEREALNYLKTHLQEKERQWLTWSNNKWRVNLSILRKEFGETIAKALNPEELAHDLDNIYIDLNLPTKLSLDILMGTIEVLPEVHQKDFRKVTKTTVKFVITYEAIMESKPKKIFLSHKSADKPIVRAFRDTLKTLGFDPWLDEDNLMAGDKLHRGILQGLQDSCAAIFFITPNYKDEKYLATEIDYAISQTTERGDMFKIITLIMNEDSEQCIVPQLLQQFVYKHPKSDLEALQEIIKALPLKMESVIFKV